MTTCIVYGLYSSREPNEIRYIGQTIQSPKDRLKQHRCDSTRKRITAVQKWFAREVQDGFKVDLRILVGSAVYNATEKEVIASYRLSGARLLNLTDGGEGTLGWRGHVGKPSPWTAERNRVSKVWLGRNHTEESKQKMREKALGKKRPWVSERNRTNHPWVGRKHDQAWFDKMRGRERSEEFKKKISAAMTGRVLTEEWRAKIGESKRGKKLSEKTKEAIRQAMIGRFVSEETRAKLRGRVVSDETRAKISAIHKGKVVSPESRAKMSIAQRAWREKKKAASE